LDTPSDEAFDNITGLATKLFHVPIALVTLVDEHRQWFKSRAGFAREETPRDIAFCDVTIRGREPLVVPDATKDPRFVRNPLVTGEPGIRFYAGVPLRTPTGHALGSLCIIGHEPRTMTPAESTALGALARQVELELEIRRRLSMLEEFLASETETRRAKELLVSMVVHDLRSPLSVILASGAMLRADDPDSIEALGDLLDAAERMRRLVTDLLDVSLSGLGKLQPRRVDFSLAALVERVQRRGRFLARDRAQTLACELPDDPLDVYADPELVDRVLVNLVDNAVQHGPSGQTITIAASRAEGDRVRVEVRDMGKTIPEESREVIFRPFERHAGVASPRGHGLGLAFCRLAVAAHDGHIGAIPRPGGGNCFRFDLPAAASGR
jgi:signal transduction histidine kinase